MDKNKRQSEDTLWADSFRHYRQIKMTVKQNMDTTDRPKTKDNQRTDHGQTVLETTDKQQ